MAQEAVQDPGFSLVYFVFGAIVALAITVFLVFPGWFGFKKTAPVKKAVPAAGYPSWFWWSLPVLFICWFMMWARLDVLKAAEAYTFVLCGGLLFSFWMELCTSETEAFPLFLRSLRSCSCWRLFPASAGLLLNI
ncbi:hypothetical protein [Paenibacillus hexagrammi]|uniref:Uncharacterized protein n=1 Tax=Paenibacillus hexagrammi TaxID=2908839 RepID=A0ABY3SHB9_9BACL|nr:hypothetical protein [Paenibacillus sp. YPD9-1]UJF33404.1 hypothetical protein L0M14_28510 [Paenibacillus sp. YPD9-1]